MEEPERPGNHRWLEAGRRTRGRLSLGDLSLGDLATLDAAGADADALGGAIHEGLHSLQIHVPTAPRNVVCVRDVVTELRAFAANIAYLCHDFRSKLVVIRAAGCAATRDSDHLRFACPAGRAIGARVDAPLRQLAASRVYPESGQQPNATLFQYKMGLKEGFDSKARGA